MDNFFEHLKAIKFPSLSAALALLYFGYQLVETIDGNIDMLPEFMGVVLMIMGATLLIFVFVDFRYKDENNHIVSTQQKTISQLQSVVKSMSDTKKSEEKLAQKSITSGTNAEDIGGRGKRGYTLDDPDSTSTA